MTGSSFFKDDSKAFNTDQAPRARQLFESAIRRIDDLKQRRARPGAYCRSSSSSSIST
jgi:hypothetical protein